MSTLLTITIVSYSDKIHTYGSLNGLDMYEHQFSDSVCPGKSAKKAFLTIKETFEDLKYDTENCQYKDKEDGTVRLAFTASKVVDTDSAKGSYNVAMKLAFPAAFFTR